MASPIIPVLEDKPEPSRALTPVQARKATKAAIGKTLWAKRQPDMLVAAEVTGTGVAVNSETAAQVIQAMTCWFDAMGEAWKGVRVSKAQNRAMRDLIAAEGQDYVLALGEALARMQFGKGQGGGWVVELNDLLYDAVKRDKVFGKYQRGALKKAQPEQVERFIVGKRVFQVHQIDIPGEDANAILDEVPGATYAMVRKAFVAATELPISTFAQAIEGFDVSKDPHAKAGLGKILRWVRNKVEWAVAYAKHGDPEKLAGGKAARNGSERFGYADGHTISEAFLADLLGGFPATSINSARQTFDSAAQKAKPADYSAENQKRIEAQMIAWAEAEQAKADEVLRRIAEENERREAKIQVEAAVMAEYGIEKTLARTIYGGSVNQFVVANPAPLQARFPTLSPGDIQAAAFEVTHHDAAEDFIAELDSVLQQIADGTHKWRRHDDEFAIEEAFS